MIRYRSVYDIKNDIKNNSKYLHNFIFHFTGFIYEYLKGFY